MTERKTWSSRWVAMGLALMVFAAVPAMALAQDKKKNEEAAATEKGPQPE